MKQRRCPVGRLGLGLATVFLVIVASAADYPPPLPLRPAQAQTPSTDPPATTLRELVTEATPKTYENHRPNYTGYPIIESAVRAGALRVDVSLATAPLGEDDPRSATGILFDNNRRGTDEQVQLYLVYQQGAWSLNYSRGGRFELATRLVQTPVAEGRFILDVNEAGDTVEVTLPDGGRRAVSLPGSLFQFSGTTALVAQTAPFSRLVLSRLALSFADTTPVGANGPSLRDLADRRGLTVGTVASLWAFLDPRYGETLAREFNLLVPGGSLDAWDWLIRPDAERFDFAAADDIIAFAERHDMRVRGYLLPAGSVPGKLPQWLTGRTWTRDELLALVKRHIDTVVARYGDRIAEWQVASETIWEGRRLGQHYWLNMIGPDYVEQVFRWARAAAPGATLIYAFDQNHGLDRQSDAVYEHLRELKQRDVPIDVLGMEMHLNIQSPPRKDEVLSNMRRLGALGLDVAIMELDVNVYAPGVAREEKLRRQAQVYSEMLEVCLESSTCPSYTMWGFTDAHSWVLDPASGYPFGPGEAPLVFDANYQPKPAYSAVRRVLE